MSPPFCFNVRFGPLESANQVPASDIRFWPCEINISNTPTTLVLNIGLGQSKDRRHLSPATTQEMSDELL